MIGTIGFSSSACAAATVAMGSGALAQSVPRYDERADGPLQLVVGGLLLLDAGVGDERRTAAGARHVGGTYRILETCIYQGVDAAAATPRFRF